MKKNRLFLVKNRVLFDFLRSLEDLIAKAKEREIRDKTAISEGKTLMKSGFSEELGDLMEFELIKGYFHLIFL